MIEKLYEHSVFQGISATFTRRKIQKYQQQLGHGQDSELHKMMGDLYHHLGEEALAVESYQAAAASVLQDARPLTTSRSDELLNIYKQILAVTPQAQDVGNRLAEEYQRRGLDYRAIELHSTLAERYRRQGEYRKATEQYQRIFAIEPGSISARVTCANLYCQLGDTARGAQEYTYIGDLYFEHQKYDGALEYYQQALTFTPSDERLSYKIRMTQQILDGTLIPEVQASLQKLSLINHESAHLERSLAEKERIEGELRQNIQRLKQRYAQSVASKNEKLHVTQKRFDELSIYVAVLKDNLEQIAVEKQRLQEQVTHESRRKEHLARKLSTLHTLHAAQDSRPPATSDDAKRLETAMARLNQEKSRLEKRLQRKIEQSAERETLLREHLQEQISKGSSLTRQLSDVTQEQKRIEEKLHLQLQESLRRERFLQEQMKQLIEQHEVALRHVEREKDDLEKKYRTTQARINVVEKHNMHNLEHVQDELSRQYARESTFSEQFHESLQELTDLIQHQEQEIRQLESLQP